MQEGYHVGKRNDQLRKSVFISQEGQLLCFLLYLCLPFLLPLLVVVKSYCVRRQINLVNLRQPSAMRLINAALPAYFKSGDQAIGGMTFGTETIPQVYKILGPGNQYVTAAKQKATQYGVSIDMPAGPSELLVVADEQQSFLCRSRFTVTSRARTDSQVVLVSTSQDTIDKVKDEVQKQLEALPEKKSLHKRLQTQRPFTLLLNPMPLLLSTNTDLNTISFVWPTKTSLSKGWPTLDRCLLGIILLKVQVITLRGPITPYRPMGTPNNTVELTWIVFSRRLAFKR